MVNSTDEFWDVDGVSLQTLTQNLKSIGGDRMAPPPLRGDNPVVPGAPGSSFVAKMPGERTMTLEGWVTGSRETLTPMHRNLAWNPALAGGRGIMAQQVVDGGDAGDVPNNVLAGQDIAVAPTWPVTDTLDGGTPAAAGATLMDGGTPTDGGGTGGDGGAPVEDKTYQLDGGMI